MYPAAIRPSLLIDVYSRNELTTNRSQLHQLFTSQRDIFTVTAGEGLMATVPGGMPSQ